MTDIKKMRLFYEVWKDVFSNRSLPTNDLPKDFKLRIVTGMWAESAEFIADEFERE